MSEFSVTTVLVTENCINCGIQFAMPKDYKQELLRTHKSFYCPLGHSMSYLGESVEEKMRRERDIAKQQLARAEEETRQANIKRYEEEQKRKKAEQATRRLQKRTAAGTCPCCQRTFSNMAVHMKKQHPQFVAEQASNIVPMKKAK